MQDNVQKPLKIIYLGDSSASSNSHHRAEALRRLGCIIDVIDPYEFLKSKPQYRRWIEYRIGYHFLAKYILERIIYLFQDTSETYDLIWVNGGELQDHQLLDG